MRCLVEMECGQKYRDQTIDWTPVSCLDNPDETSPLCTAFFFLPNSRVCVSQLTNPCLPREGRDRGGAEGGDKRSQRVVTKLGVPARNSKNIMKSISV